MNGQEQLQQALDAVRINNLAIKTNQKFWSAKNAVSKTGLTITDPLVEYDYMFGSPAGAGNQRDFAITQRLDFPSVYKRKKTVSQLQINQSQPYLRAYEQTILLEAKLQLIQLIYLNKKRNIVQARLTKTQKLVTDYAKKLEQAAVTILDYNKARLQLVTIQNELALLENEQQIIHTKLAELNGGTTFHFKDSSYPAYPDIPNFEWIDSIIEANDPVIQSLEQEKIISQQQVLVQKALNLPKFEAGYHSQGILGQSYKGIHGGIVIPLWENRGRLEAARKQAEHAQQLEISSRLEHSKEHQQLYEQLAVRETAMKNYKSTLDSLNNEYLLNKALQLGQITVIQYFMEESYYYQAVDMYLRLEHEYQQTLARLFKYQL
ncbi:TolC family protein [Flavihumibacter cheonanensis]